MARQNPQWQPTDLERRQQAERDKKMGIFRKTKKKPEKKKKVRVEEFEFDKGFDFGMPDFKLQPGQIIKTRQSGRNEFHRLFKELGEDRMPDFEGEPWGKSPWERGRNTRLDKSKYSFAMEVLSKKHRTIIEVEEGYMGDYTVFRTRGRKMDRVFKLSHTQVASAQSIEQLIDIIERGLDLNDELPGKKIDERITGEPKTPTDEWAEKWAKENS